MPTKKTRKPSRRTTKSSRSTHPSTPKKRSARSRTSAPKRSASSRKKPATKARGGHNLENMTKQELYAKARASHVEGRSGMSKDELLRALRKS